MEHKLGNTLVLVGTVHDDTGAFVSADSTPTITVFIAGTGPSSYEDENMTEVETGLYSFDAVISGGNGFATGQNIYAMATTTVDGVTGKTLLWSGRVVTTIAEDALQPTTAGRKLDVSAGGEAGIDFANIGSPTTTVNLSGTTIKTATDVATAVASVASAVTTVDTVVDGIADAVDDVYADTHTTGVLVLDGAISSDSFTVGTVDGVETGILEQIRQLWRRFFKKVVYDKEADTIETYADNGSTVLTSQATVNDSEEQSHGAAT